MNDSLRVAQVDDIPWLLPLAKQVFCDAFERFYEPDVFWGYVDRAYTVAQWEAEMADPHSQFVVACEGETGVGYTKLFWNSEEYPDDVPIANCLEVARLYVDYAYHGKGYAQALMDYAYEVAHQQGREGLWLGVWQRNDRAMGFYRKNGFQVVGTHPFEMGAGVIEEDFVMYRNVPPRNLTPTNIVS